MEGVRGRSTEARRRESTGSRKIAPVLLQMWPSKTRRAESGRESCFPSMAHYTIFLSLSYIQFYAYGTIGIKRKPSSMQEASIGTLGQSLRHPECRARTVVELSAWYDRGSLLLVVEEVIVATTRNIRIDSGIMSPHTLYNLQFTPH
jgi:hypothetical protein